MAKAKTTDQFANQAVITCTETGANTLTFKKLETGISLFEKIAWILHRIEYIMSDPSATLFNSDKDLITMALTTTDQLTSINLTNAAVLDFQSFERLDFGAAASGGLFNRVWTKDLNILPGGGILVPPNPLYLAVVGTGLAAASTVIAKIFYTNRELSPDEYWELVEARRIISST